VSIIGSFLLGRAGCAGCASRCFPPQATSILRPHTALLLLARLVLARISRFVLRPAAPFALLLGVALALLPGLGRAATFTVDDPRDIPDFNVGNGACEALLSFEPFVFVCTLRAAIQEANALPGADTIELPAGRYELTIPDDLSEGEEDASAVGDLDITDDLTLVAGEGTVIIDASELPESRVLEIRPGAIVSLEVLPTTELFSIQGGSASTSSISPGDGGGILNFGSLQTSRVTVQNNSANRDGGGIANFGELTLGENTVVRSNSANNSGGGIANLGDLTVRESTIGGLNAEDGNVAQDGNGGGIWLLVTEGGGSAVRIEDSLIAGNQANTVGVAQGDGGGIWSNRELLLLRSTVADNAAAFDGGGILNSGDLTLDESTVVRSNSANNSGGGIANLGDLTVRESTIGGLNAEDGNVAQDGNGGGIWVASTDSGSVARIEDSLIAGNRADTSGEVRGDGGGIWNGGELFVLRSTVADNEADFDGGGVFNAGLLTARNSTLSGNTAAIGVGGGLFNSFGSGDIARLEFVTIAENEADSGGGGIANFDTVHARASLVVSNAPEDCLFETVVDSGGFNRDSDGSCALSELTDGTVPAPGVELLAENGGPTPTHALLSESPAVDQIPADECTLVEGFDLPVDNSTDQRGQPRPVGELNGLCDVGAFELQSRCGDGILDDGEQCDLGELNGNPGSCCTDTCELRSLGDTCRDSAGLCDVAETCTGDSPFCPADELVPSGDVCRDSAGLCDVAEACTGDSPVCPADELVPSGDICRDSAGLCDVAEACTGDSPVCPANELAPPGTTCRESAGLCDVAEACTGDSPACPADALMPPGTTCRDSAGLCDVAEACTGGSPACPANELAPPGTICRESAGLCDVGETCTGDFPACPADEFALFGTTCREKAWVCDIEEKCRGDSAACPTDEVLPEGEQCANAQFADWAEDVEVAASSDGTTALIFVAAQSAGLRIAQLGTLGIEPMGNFSPTMCPNDPSEEFWVEDVEHDAISEQLYLPAGPCGVAVVDVLDPTAPVLVGMIDTPGWAEDAKLVGDTLYVADFEGGLAAFDVGSGFPALQLGTVGFADFGFGAAIDVEVVDSLAYVATAVSDPSGPGRRGGLRVVDVSNPADPVSVGSFDTDPDLGPAQDVEVTLLQDGRRLAFLSSWMEGLIILDVTDPSVPMRLEVRDSDSGDLSSAIETVSATFEATVQGQMLFLADGIRELRMFQIPSFPEDGVIDVREHSAFAPQCDDPCYAWDVEFAGELAYVAFGEGFEEGATTGGIQVVHAKEMGVSGKLLTTPIPEPGRLGLALVALAVLLGLSLATRRRAGATRARHRS